MKPKILAIVKQSGIAIPKPYADTNQIYVANDDDLANFYYRAQAAALDEAASFTNLQKCKCDIVLLNLAAQKLKKAIDD
jgi:hypothetical protein